MNRRWFIAGISSLALISSVKAGTLISSISASSADGAQFQRLANVWGLLNWNPAFNLTWLDGNTDVTAALIVAITAARSSVSGTSVAGILLPAGFYKISSPIDTHRVALLGLDGGAVVLAQSVGAAKAISWDQSDQTLWDPKGPPCAANLEIRGRDAAPGSIAYTAGSTGISCGVPFGRWDNVSVTNFDKNISWGNYSYNQLFTSVTAAYGNYPTYWPAALSVSGERVSFLNCTLYNNSNGPYINNNTVGGASASGSFRFNTCSIDYNVAGHGNFIGPSSSPNDIFTSIVFDDCHFETSISVSGNSNPRISNGVNLEIANSYIYENEFGTYPYIINSPSPARCSVIGDFWGLEGTGNWNEGSGEWRAYGNIQRYGGAVHITASVTDSPE